MSNALTYALGIIALALLVGAVDRQSPVALEAHIRDADQRKELPPEERAYWKRHERNQRLCRGQDYIEQCCTDARPELTCLTHEDIR